MHVLRIFVRDFVNRRLSTTPSTPQTKNAPPKERAIIHHSIIRSTEEINEAQYVEHYACEGEKVPDHVGELESS